MHSTATDVRPSTATMSHSTASAAGEGAAPAPAVPLAQRYRAVRRQTEAIAAPLAVEDMIIQSMEDVSPMRWHLAHTSWFFERFVLRSADPNYTPVHPQYEYLFNSYYNTVGPQHCRPQRGLLSRPTVAQVFAYRAEIDRRMGELFERLTPGSELHETLVPIITLGLQHEQQHQELMATDIKHVLSCNPLLPSYHDAAAASPTPQPESCTLPEPSWLDLEAGVRSIGTDPSPDGFTFDNESPRHRVFIEACSLASRPVSNAEYLRFIEDGGYERANLWLAMGWATVKEEGWSQPIYWFKDGNRWRQFTAFGAVDLRPDEPVCHLSYFEADAYARWAGARLPTEAEWEAFATEHGGGGTGGTNAPTDADALPGRFADDRIFHPLPLEPTDAPQRVMGDLWEWTSSSYGPYPGYAAAEGALGEYNGKFMCNQYVLRGGSCATPRDHLRATYRNFFPPASRWQFAGLRLAQQR